MFFENPAPFVNRITIRASAHTLDEPFIIYKQVKTVNLKFWSGTPNDIPDMSADEPPKLLKAKASNLST